MSDDDDRWNGQYDSGREAGYEEGYAHGVVAGRKKAADTLRMMLKIMAKDKDADVARCAKFLLEGFDQQMAGTL